MAGCGLSRWLLCLWAVMWRSGGVCCFVVGGVGVGVCCACGWCGGVGL